MNCHSIVVKVTYRLTFNPKIFGELASSRCSLVRKRR